jgi:hypothetical protein
VDELIGLAKGQLGRIKALCAQVGLKYVELPDFVLGAGVGVSFGDDGHVVLSVMGGGSESKLMITSGILRDIKQDRLTALTACNSLTSGNSLFPVYLHDADNGWSLLMQLTYPIDLLLDNPEYFSLIVRAAAQIAANHRAEIAEKYDLGGGRWPWTAEDLNILLIKSMA